MEIEPLKEGGTMVRLEWKKGQWGLSPVSHPRCPSFHPICQTLDLPELFYYTDYERIMKVIQ